MTTMPRSTGTVWAAALAVAMMASGVAMGEVANGGQEPLPVPADAMPQPERNALMVFANEHQDCGSFFDGCQICRRQDNRSLACSTPGIACLREAWRCHTPASAPPAAPENPAPEQK